jgi:hypothetical protein
LGDHWVSDFSSHHWVSDFSSLYVADSKLCVKETLQMIAGDGGTFLTVLPRTRAEDKWFLKYTNEQLIEWQEVRREPNPRRKNGPDVVYEGYESPQLSQEGFRIFWYRSSQKREQDAQQRFKKLTAARVRLEALESRSGRHRLRSKSASNSRPSSVAGRFREGLRRLETVLRTLVLT